MNNLADLTRLIADWIAPLLVWIAGTEFRPTLAALWTAAVSAGDMALLYLRYYWHHDLTVFARKWHEWVVILVGIIWILMAVVLFFSREDCRPHHYPFFVWVLLALVPVIPVIKAMRRILRDQDVRPIGLDTIRNEIHGWTRAAETRFPMRPMPAGLTPEQERQFKQHTYDLRNQAVAIEMRRRLPGIVATVSGPSDRSPIPHVTSSIILPGVLAALGIFINTVFVGGSGVVMSIFMDLITVLVDMLGALTTLSVTFGLLVTMDVVERSGNLLAHVANAVYQGVFRIAIGIDEHNVDQIAGRITAQFIADGRAQVKQFVLPVKLLNLFIAAMSIWAHPYVVVGLLILSIGLGAVGVLVRLGGGGTDAARSARNAELTGSLMTTAIIIRLILTNLNPFLGYPLQKTWGLVIRAINFMTGLGSFHHDPGWRGWGSMLLRVGFAYTGVILLAALLIAVEVVAVSNRNRAPDSAVAILMRRATVLAAVSVLGLMFLGSVGNPHFDNAFAVPTCPVEPEALRRINPVALKATYDKVPTEPLVAPLTTPAPVPQPPQPVAVLSRRGGHSPRRSTPSDIDVAFHCTPRVNTPLCSELTADVRELIRAGCGCH